MIKYISIVLFMLTGVSSIAQNSFVSIGEINNILPVWQEAKVMERQLRIRQQTVVPEVMRRAGVDMWMVSRDEYILYVSLAEGNDEGLIFDRSEVLIFYDKGKNEGIERWVADFDEVESIITSYNPSKIGISEELSQKTRSKFQKKFTSSDPIGTSFLQIRSNEEMVIFQHVGRVAHEIIAEAFSNKVIIPDVTTTDELNWWIRQRYRDLGLLTSDHPTITVQRSKSERIKYAEGDEHFRIDIPPRNGYNTIIRRGDILSCDTGIDYLGLGTDTQQVAYVLMEGEAEPPEGLKQAIKNTNQLQDLFALEFSEGRKSDHIVNAALEKAKGAGLRASIYSHPIPHFLKRYSLNGGFFHGTRYGVGPDMGDGENGEELSAERGGPVYNNTVYAMELDTKTVVSEWGNQLVRIVLEQTIAFTKDKVVFLGGRQMKFHLIK